jgi:Domain of unknown function (DUF4105)
MRVAALVLLSSLLVPRAARAGEPGSELSVSLLTMGPGDHPFTKFGHDALLVRNLLTGTARVYNYGTFAFDSPWLIVDFLQGRFRYWLSVAPLERVLRQYAADNRSVAAQELRLTPSERRSVAEFLEWNARDQNKYYKYDYYRDNCATRVRDVIDRAIGGRLHDATRGPARMSFRAHTLRLTADDRALALGLDVAMGDLIDKPITAWDEMFLPASVEQSVRLVKVPSLAGVEPLVSAEHELFEAHRAPTRQTPPSWSLPMLGAGLGIGSVFAALGALAARGHRAARVALGAWLGILGLKLGILGCLITGLWAFTDHQVTYRNENVLQCVPWALALVWLGIGVARGNPRRIAMARAVAITAAIASTLGLVMKVFATFDQSNVEIIALVLPVWVGAVMGVSLMRAGRAAGHRT